MAGESFLTLRNSVYARIAAVSSQLSEFYKAPLIAAELDAHEVNVRTLAGETTAVIAYHFKCYSLRAAREIGEDGHRSLQRARFQLQSRSQVIARKRRELLDLRGACFSVLPPSRRHAAAPANCTLDIALAA